MLLLGFLINFFLIAVYLIGYSNGKRSVLKAGAQEGINVIEEFKRKYLEPKKDYVERDPWDEQRIDLEESPDVIQTIPEEQRNERI